MAGAGYKLFNTGDVLTAAQVNTYLMEQTVMVFADAAARTTALSGVVSEGMISYLKDTNAVEVYNGSAWVASDDPNAIQNTIVDAKGDLISASAADTPARLAVGNNGETLVADSSTSTGLRWQGNFAAGKNKFINAALDWNQRATTSTTSTGVFLFDRWATSFSDGTCTGSAETFTPGTAPVAGYEAKNYVRIVSSGQTATTAIAGIRQRLESVRSFAGETVTVSFWAKASSGTPNVVVWLSQNFGTGGSPSTDVQTGTTKKAITTSWARYSFTVAVPSISGKTIGTNNNDFLQIACVISAGTDRAAYTDSIGIQSATIDMWGFQIESGNVATAFQTATGTLAGELSACLRYFQVLGGTSAVEGLAVGFNYSTTAAACVLPFRQQMRSAPTITFGTGAAASDFALYNASGTALTVTSTTIVDAALGSSRILASVASGLVQGDGTNLITNSTTGKLFVSAEL